MGNWKTGFLCDGKTVYTSGESGKLYTYDIDTQENIDTINSAELFASYITNVIFFNIK